jgi:uncharacterized protein
VDKKIIKIAQLYAQKVKDYMPVDMIILYGSHVRGTAQKSSDIDIAVVVNNFKGDYLKISADLFGLVRGVNIRIEPVLLCRSMDKSGFLESVIKQGKVVYKASA